MTWQSAKYLSGSVLGLAYLIFAVMVLHSDRTTSTSFLRGMGFMLVTLPVSAPLEILGYKLDFRSNLQAVPAIAVCAGIVFLLGMGIVYGVQALCGATGTK